MMSDLLLRLRATYRVFVSAILIAALPIGVAVHADGVQVYVLDQQSTYKRLEVREQNGIKTFWICPNTVDCSGGQQLGEAITIKKGTPFFHWADGDTTDRLIRQKYVDGGEMQALRKGSDSMVAGGGYYVSTDPNNSKTFGGPNGKLSVLEAPSDLNGINVKYFAANNQPYNEVNALLEQAGVQVVYYNQGDGWYNVIHPSATTQIRAPTGAHFARSAGVLKGNYSLAGLIALDGVSPLEMTPELLAKYPSLKRIMEAKSLDEIRTISDLSSLNNTLSLISKDYNSPISRRIAALYAPELKSYFIKKFKLNGVKDSTASEIRVALSLGVKPEEFVPDYSLSRTFADSPLKPKPETPQMDFGRKLHLAYEFIDSDDIAAAMASGSPSPWTRYDQDGVSLLDRWVESTRVKRPLLETYRTLSGTGPSGNYREHRIIAGGDVYVNGQGYYRITAHQKKNLDQDPFLVVESVADPQAQNGDTILCRHEYPSAATFEKYSDRLSPTLKADLTKAKAAGLLKNEQSPEFKQLTRAIVKELVEKLENGPIDSYMQIYSDLVSVHPFPDYNGRSTRAWVKNHRGKPVFLEVFDDDLFASPEELYIADIVGQRQLETVGEALARQERLNPGMPAYYDAEELWRLQVGATEAPTDPAAFVAGVKQWYNDPSNQNFVRTKDHVNVAKRQSVCFKSFFHRLLFTP